MPKRVREDEKGSREREKSGLREQECEETEGRWIFHLVDLVPYGDWYWLLWQIKDSSMCHSNNMVNEGQSNEFILQVKETLQMYFHAILLTWLYFFPVAFLIVWMILLESVYEPRLPRSVVPLSVTIIRAKKWILAVVRQSESYHQLVLRCISCSQCQLWLELWFLRRRLNDITHDSIESQ